MELIPKLLDSSSSDEEDEIQIKRPREIRTRNNPFEDFDNIDFKSHFRLSKESVNELLKIIGSNLEPLDNRNNPVSAINQLLVTLRFYATGSYQIEIGDYFNISQSTVCRIVPRVTRLIAQLRPQYIQMPEDRQSIKKIKNEFYAIRGFPDVIGAIGCTHIKIQSPGGENAETFRNSKGYYSIKVQAVCDPQLRVLDIVARCPGSADDMTVFNNSLLMTRFAANGFPNCYILGGNGYTCKKYLLTPVLNTSTPAETRYNISQIATRNPVERLFDDIKRRFPCLSIGMQIGVETVLEVIVATFVLHNICISLGDEEQENYVNTDNENTTVRTVLINTVFKV